MFFVFYFRQYWGTLLWIVKGLALVIFMAYIAIPIFIRANPWIVPKVIFSNVGEFDQLNDSIAFIL